MYLGVESLRVYVFANCRQLGLSLRFVHMSDPKKSDIAVPVG